MNNWVTDHSIADEMLRGANAELPGFQRLEETGHFKTLNNLFLQAASDVDSVLDLGCGAAEFGRIYSFFEYTGVDLEHVLERTARKKNPHLNYIAFNAYEDDYTFMQDHDLILMNAFISEIQKSDEIFETILQNAKRFIILHRQKLHDFEDAAVKYVKYHGYLNKEYTCAILSNQYFEDIIKKHNFKIIDKQHSSTPEEWSILLKKETTP
jgi:SAM-dependent methyltransferase